MIPSSMIGKLSGTMRKMWSCPKIRFVTYSFVSYLSRPIENLCLGPICIALTVLLRFARFIPAPLSTKYTRSVVRVDKGIVSNLPVVVQLILCKLLPGSPEPCLVYSRWNLSLVGEWIISGVAVFGCVSSS